jgi:uncharacterized protein YgiM (DUF1202 family)
VLRMKLVNRFSLLWAVIPLFILAAVALIAAGGPSGFTANAQEATPTTTTPEPTSTQQADTQNTTTFEVDQAVVVTTSDGDSLNFREDSNTDADVIASLPEGTWAVVVDGPVDEDDVTWYEIEVDEETGWVTAEFLGDAAAEGTLEADTTVYVNTDSLNLRESADIDSEALTELTRDTTATVLDGPTDADDFSWYELDVDGTTGWAVREFLALAPSSGETDVETATTEGATLTANTDTLNVRDTAGLSGNILETIAFGDTVTDLGVVETVDGYDWSQIETASGTTGWVASIYVTTDSAVLSLTVDAVATINADNVNLRDSASLSGASVGTVNTGDTVTILSNSEAADDLLWYQVETADGTTGWISGEFLTV